MENANGQPYNKFELPLKWGLIIGIISILLFTIYAMFMMESMGLMGSMVLGIVTFVVMLVLLGVMAKQRRKDLGGYMTLREAFQPIFIAILIIVVMTTIYNALYVNVIDPEYMARTKEMTTNMTANFGGEEAADAAAEQFDKQMEKQNSIGGRAVSFAITIIFYSLFGLIVAAIVKKNKPEHLA